MGRSLDELRKKIYGSATPDQKITSAVQAKALEIQKPEPSKISTTSTSSGKTSTSVTTKPTRSWSQVSSRLSELESSLQSDKDVLSRLDNDLVANPSSGNLAKYNQVAKRYQSSINEYNSLVGDYNYYQSLDGLKSRKDQAEKERDEAHQAFLNLYALESDPSQSGTKISASSKYKTAEEARKAWKSAEKEYNDVLSKYSDTKNKQKLTELKTDSAASTTYDKAKDLEADLKKLQEMQITVGATGSAESSDLSYFKKKYGTSDDSVFDLQQTLQNRLQDLKNNLQGAGYSYDQISGYQERETSRSEYEQKQAEWSQFAKDHPVVSSVASVLVSPFQGIDFIKMVGSGTMDTEDLDSYVPPNSYDADIVNFVNTVRGTISEELEKSTDWEIYGQNVASFLYQTGLSIGESAAQVAALGPAATYFMGASAAANQAADVIQRGGTTQQAFMGGLTAGIAEGLFEKVSIERLLDPSKFSTKTLKDTLRSLVSQGAVEASEESLTEISNILTDAAVMSQDSSYDLAVQSYRDSGMSETEAKQQAFLDSIGQVVWAGVGGFLSGVSLGGARISIDKLGTQADAARTGAQLKLRMSDGVDTSVISEIQKGMDAAEGSEARVLAESAQKQLDTKKRVSNATLGRLVWANQGNAAQDLQILQKQSGDQQAQQVLSQAAEELRKFGTLTSATASKVHTVAAQEILGAVTVSEKEAAAKAANPQADVQSAAVTAFTNTGMKLKTAQEKAAIVEKLMAGEEVSNRDINKLNPSSPAARAVFSQITGVEFPEGKLSQDQLYNRYRSAKDVKTSAQVQAETESAPSVQGAEAMLSGQLPEGVSVDTILQSAVADTADVKAANDASAAQLLGEQLGELDVNGQPLVSFSEFSEMYRSQVNASATREELARAYDQYRREVQTGEFQGQRRTRADFAATLRSAPGGEKLTDAEIENLFQKVQNANREGEDGFDRYALNESERREKKLIRKLPEDRRADTAAEMSRRGELSRAAKYMGDVLRDLGIAPDVVVEYGDENTRMADAFVDGSGVIHFNGDKISGASMMQYILGHELTHVAARTEAGKTISDTILETFQKLNQMGVLSGKTKTWMSDVDGQLDRLLKRYQSHAKVVGDDPAIIDREYVKEELAADLMRQVFVSENLMSRFAGERPSLLMRAQRAAEKLLAKLTGNDDLKTVVEAREALQELGDTFSRVLRQSEAESTYRSSQPVETETGEAVAVSEENGDMKFSLSTYDDQGRQVLQDWLNVAVDRGDLTRKDADSIKVSLEEIYRVCREHQKEYAPFDAWSEAKVVTDAQGRPVFSVVKSNGEYAMNLDFSTVCKKRRTLDAVLNALVRDGRATANRIAEPQIVQINNIIRSHGFETACALCFVDAKRFRQDKIAGDFTAMYNRAVRSLVPSGKDIHINTFDFAGRGTEQQEQALDSLPDSEIDLTKLQKALSRYGERTVSHKIAKHLLDIPADRKLLDKGDFLSSAGFNVLSRENPDILSLFNSKKGSGGPKATFGDVQYFNEIISSRTFNAEKAFSVGGVRIQSFSDYVPGMVFDYAQVVSDLAAKKLPAHAYTKEELFVKQFGLTGIKINMSLVPAVVDDGIAPGLDSRGNYVWDDESFDYNTAIEIQNAAGYSRNCGTIAVGISDEHIRKLLDDDNIRMVIPYHKSGLNPIVARMNKIDKFKNYTLEQNTRYADGKKVAPEDLEKLGIPDFNQEMRRLGDPRAAAESYVRFCESHDLIPKFENFAYQQVGGVYVEEDGQRKVNPNYYKLLEDFTVYDQGEYVEQQAVQPIYPTEESAFGNMESLILRGLSEDADLEARRSSEVQSIVQEVKDTLGDVRTDSEARYALPDQDLSFPEQVELTSMNKFNEVMAPAVSGQYGTAESALYVAKEPNSLLQEIGFGDLPIVITQQHVRQIMARRENSSGQVINEHNHQLTQDQVSRIPDLIQNPAAILRAKGRPGSAVIVTTETDYKGRPIIIPIKSNGMNLVYDGKLGPAHVITSMYGRDHFDRFFSDSVSAGDLLYVDKKRIDPIMTTAGYQSSGLLSGIDSQTILGRITPNVNTKSRRYELPDADLDQAAIDYFGTTRNWEVTGYIQKDGTQLDFSGKKRGGPGNTRDEDHREIWAAYGEPAEMTDIQSEIDYLARGNIRIMPESNGINLSVLPTKAQESKLRQFINQSGGEVIVDIDSVEGKPMESMEYPRGTSSSKIISDIRSVFSGEAVSPASQVADFRYELPDQTVDTENQPADNTSEVSDVYRTFETREASIRENGETAVLYNPYYRYFKLYVNGNPASEQNHGFDFDTKQDAQDFLTTNRKYLEQYDPTLDPDLMSDSEDFAETTVERNYRRYEQSKAKRTSLIEIMNRIRRADYRVYDLYSLAEQLGFEDYEDLAPTDLADAIVNSIQDRIDSRDVNMLEAQAPARGLWLRPSATGKSDTKYSITPEFEKWYKETYGVTGDLTDAQLQRALARQEEKTRRAEESVQAERSKAKVDAENTLTAWLIYHKKTMRRLNRDLQKKASDRIAELRKEKSQALQDKELAWRIYHEATVREQQAAARKAEQDIRKEMSQQKRDAVSAAVTVERAKASVQHDADVMAFKRQAAERLRIQSGRYADQKEHAKDQVRLKRKAAERALKDSRQAAKKRAVLQTENGMVDTIRKSPKERTFVERRQEAADKLRTLGRSAYATFVNQAQAIDDFAKRQSGGVLSSTLVNVLGGSTTTVESIFKTGLVDRAGNQIGDSMKNVFLVWDGKKVDEAKQALLQDYMLHAHNVDRMSFVKKARAKLEAFETENPWLRDMDQKEFARLVAMTEAEIAKSGKKEAHGRAVEYAKLLDRYNRSQDKPIFADANGNAVTAETSQAIVEQYLSENPWLQEKAQGIYDWWDQFMRTWAVGDSLTLEQYETMREIYPHYVPTYRADKKGVGAANFVGAGGATIGQAVKKAKGGFSEVVNIEDSFANLANKIVRLARTNELYKNIIDTALLEDGENSNVADMAVFDWDSVKMGDSYRTESGEVVSTFSNGFDVSDRIDEAERPGLLKAKDGYKLSAWYDGRLLSAYINEDLYKSIAAVTGSNETDATRAFLKTGNFLTGPMKTAITGVNPAFGLRNVSRDFPTAIINSISGMAFPKYYARALVEMRQDTDHWKTFNALGGTHATYYNDNKGFASSMARRKGPIGKAAEGLGWFNEVTEAQTRFAEYLATIDRLGDTYESRLLGIKNSAEVTVDFSRKGRFGKYINAWIPYWNPAVQGIDKVVRSLVDSPDGSAVWKQATRTLGRAAMTTVLLEAVLQVTLAALGRRDDWEQLDDRTKDTYYCIPLPAEHTFLKIPKNREWGSILGTPFMRMLEWANGREDPFENYVETSLIPNFLPPMPSDTVGFSQWNDLTTNEDFAGRTIVPYAYQQGSLTEQYDSDTSVVTKWIAQHLGLSPMQLDYIIGDYFGDFGEVYQKATAPSTWSGDSSLRDLGSSTIDTFFGGFEADSRYSNAAVSKYYDTLDELSRVVQDKKNQMGTDAAKETIEYKTQTALNKLYGDAITELNTQVRGMADGEEKDALKAEIAQLASEALDFYEQSMSGQIESPQLQAEYNEYDPAVRNALIDLDSYSKDYSFKPTGKASAKYTDPDDSDREYILDEEQKDMFHEIYVQQYNDFAEDLIGRTEYTSADGNIKSELLEGMRDDVLDATKEEFFSRLKQNGVRSTPKA